MMWDTVIIGAGVIGTAVARFLSRYQARVLVVEKEEDVCTGTSKANSAIVHAGYDAENGSLKAKYNLEGSRMMEALTKELDVPYKRCGSLVVCLSEEDRPALKRLYENGVKNNVQGLRIVEREELLKLEPNISDDAVAALYAPSGAIVCPFLLTVAFAENAAENGVKFEFNTTVRTIERTEDGIFRLETDRGEIRSRTVVNAAGVYADVFHNMMSDRKIRITPRKGEYLLLDHETEGYVRHTVFQLPGKLGKGVLVSPTVHGNIIVGPTAEDVEDKEAVNTTAEGLSDVIRKSAKALQNVPVGKTITSFAGLRAHEDGHDFIIEESRQNPGFFDAAGIESPGLSAAPAIGRAVAEFVRVRLGLAEKHGFKPTRKGIVRVSELSTEEWNALIRENPAYGQIVCRCETVSEGEIVDAIRRPVGARSLDGVKRRVRAGMGRCQAGFCTPKVLEILERELGMDESAVTKSGGASVLITGNIKEEL